jgi:uncharacterized protein YuzE
MKLSIDKQADALYLRLDDSPIVDSQRAAPGVVVDYNDRDEVVAIEILHLSRRSSPLRLNELVVQTAGGPEKTVRT